MKEREGMDDLHDMDAELRALLREGAAPLVAPPDAEARVRAALVASLPALGVATVVADAAHHATATATNATVTSAALGTTMSLGKAIALATLTFSLGSGAGALIVSRGAPAERIVYVERPSAGTAVASPAPTATDALIVPVAELPTAKESAGAAPSAPSSSPFASTLAVERKVLDEARVAFTRGDGAAALEILERHEKMHPRGALAEERDALRVRALAEVGRMDEARDRAAKFHARYPQSLLGPAVSAATERR